MGAEIALHNRDAGPWLPIWSRHSPRATQVYRREDGEWKVARRHADTVPDNERPKHSR
jgi:ketosteroid isomerase-like protein